MDLIAELVDAFRTDEGIFTVRVLGRPQARGGWEGYIELVPVDGSGEALLTPRETTQPTRADLLAWAEALTPIFLEGALERAKKRARPPMHSEPRLVAPPAEAVLDPFEIGAKEGEIFLERRLDALADEHLVAIIAAYRIASPEVDLASLDRSALTAIILAAVRAAEATWRARGVV